MSGDADSPDPGAPDLDAPDLAALQAAMAQGSAAEAEGDPARAVEAYVEALRLDPEDRAGAGLRLAALGAADGLARAPEAYVAALFDQQAAGFDELLVEELGYDGPLQLRGLLEARPDDPARYARFLDLGCGAGLCAEALADLTDRRVGLDLSARMLEEAAEKDLYHGLYQGDAVGFLDSEAAAEEGPFDLIASADMVPYLGDLAPLFAGVAARLAPGGAFLLSAEALDGDPDGPGWAVLPARRFAHRAGYLAATLTAAGLTVAAAEESVTRYDRGAPVWSHLILATRER